MRRREAFWHTLPNCIDSVRMGTLPFIFLLFFCPGWKKKEVCSNVANEPWSACKAKTTLPAAIVVCAALHALFFPVTWQWRCKRPSSFYKDKPFSLFNDVTTMRRRCQNFLLRDLFSKYTLSVDPKRRNGEIPCRFHQKTFQALCYWILTPAGPQESLQAT